MCSLCGYRPDVPFASGGFFFMRCARVDAAVAVVADVSIIPYVDYGVVHVVDHVHVDVVDCGVVEEMAAFPASPLGAVAESARAVIKCTIKSHPRAPTSRRENKP